jgi:hypothetical protein
MKIHTLKTGMRVRWTKAVGYAVNEAREATPATDRVTHAIDAGTTGVVVADGDRVRVVLDNEVTRVYGPIDEVEWQVDGSFTASLLALRDVEVTGVIDSCPACRNASLFDSDSKRSTWSIFCVSTLTIDKSMCGATILEFDLSEETRLGAKAELERIDPLLTKIRDIIGDAEEWGSYEGSAEFEGKASQVAFRLLELIDLQLMAEEE